MNPNYSNTGAINPGNSQNEANPRTMRNFNTFPMSYEHYLTARFGDVTPFYVFDSEPKDKVPFSSFHELYSDVVPSVQLSKFRMMKDYFSVPYKAILPNTWDLIYVNPTQGDDVPDDANCYVNGLLSKLSDLWQTRQNVTSSTFIGSDDINLQLTNEFRWFLLMESFFDDGSLLSMFGCKLSKYFTGGSILPENAWFKFSNAYLQGMLDFIEYILDTSIVVATSDPDRRLVITTIEWSSNKAYHFRRLLEFLRDNDDFYFDGILLSESKIAIATTLYEILYAEKQKYFVLGSVDIPVNMSRVIAYQLAYFHFMTNDKVDFIYSADLYRQMMYGFCKNVPSFDDRIFFTYNGSVIQYDVFSGKWLNYMLQYSAYLLENPTGLASDINYGYCYWRGLLAIRKSLKYGDYFTGSRPSPLAVGDVNAPVTGSGVSAIDITKNIMMQRFLNAVNKTGRKMSDYLRSIRGANTLPLLTDPKFLARDVVGVGSQVIENTGENQGNLVSMMRSEQSKYAFEVDVEDPAVVIGVISFDVPRIYSRTIDRHFFIKDRFDMFNPYMQNIGDQEIFAAEKDARGLIPFSYTLRHMEFKQRYSIASGGFVDNLKTMVFIADNKEGEDQRYENLSPEFIRSHNTEIDRFFPSLAGYSLSTYYHFKFRFVNESSPNRNMEYSPTIL